MVIRTAVHAIHRPVGLYGPSHLMTMHTAEEDLGCNNDDVLLPIIRFSASTHVKRETGSSSERF